MNSQNLGDRNLKLVCWVIWTTLLAGVFFYQFLLGGGLPSGQDKEGLPWIFVWFSFANFTVSTALRWILVPRLKSMQAIFSTMIVGMAFAEASQFFQLLLIGPDFPDTQMPIFVLTVLCLVQWMPVFTGSKKN
jgi:hypothetical protein